MSFPRYAEYKRTGLEWIPTMPAHWSSSRLRWLGARYSGGTPDKQRIDFWTDGSIPWLNSGAVNDGLILEPSALITQEAFESSSAKWIPRGAVVIALAGQGKTKGMVAEIGFQTTCNQSMAAIVPGIKVVSRFLYWWLTNNYQNIRNMSGGDLRDGLNLELIGDICCPLPPSEEQIVIATFLDRETAKIDALVAEQEKLIALLKEKRQAVISHAVTKGLNPNAPMKPSGIEWLGEVPAYWEVRPLKRFWSVTDCKHVTAEFVEEGIPLASIREVQSQYVALDGAKRTTEEFYEQLIEGQREPRAGDLIFSRNATVGEVAQVPADHVRFAMGQDVCLLRRLDPSLSPDYMQHVIRSPVVIEQLNTFMVGSTFKRVNVEQIRALFVPCPPGTEQVEISNYLSARTAAFDELTMDAERAITLLKERRSTLISAAVTGQIDVRGAIPAEAA